MNAINPISVNSLGKAYPRDRSPFRILLDNLLGRSPGEQFWALKDVSFEVVKGQAFGIVGRNGSGKSTLLQLICGTLKPTSGSLSTQGRISAILELGAGFNPEFSGRENVYLYASAFGLTESEIEARISQIQTFADLGGYFDRPVREYSSGMYARLAFGVCAHIDAEILVVDEILGVGDSAFQKRCRDRMNVFISSGTLIFVSHDPGAVTAVCDHGLWLEHGEPAAFGDIDTVLRAYGDALYGTDAIDSSIRIGDFNDERAIGSAGNEESAQESVTSDSDKSDDRIDITEQNVMQVGPFDPNSPAHGFGGCTIVACGFVGNSGEFTDQVRGGDIVDFQIHAKVERKLERPIAGFMLRNEFGQNLFGDNTYIAYQHEPVRSEAGQLLEANFRFKMPYLPDGVYFFAPSIIEGTQHDHIQLDWREEAVKINVSGSPVKYGKIGVPLRSVKFS